MAGGRNGVVGDDFHVERLRLAGDGLTDAAEAGDAHDLTGDALETRHDLVIPDAVLLHTAVILADAALEVEHEGHGALGGLLRAVVEDGTDGNALFLRVVEVGLVIAGGLEGDDLAVIHGVDLFLAEVDVAVDNNIGVLDLDDEVRLVQRLQAGGAPIVGRNRPAELMVNVMSRMFMISCVNQPKIAPSTPTSRDATRPTCRSVFSDTLGLM